MPEIKTTSVQQYLEAQDSIKGWLDPEDVFVFQEINAFQGLNNIRGDLLEIGVYQGKSAILMGYLTRAGERLVVCDLFQLPAQTEENQAENKFWYADLTQELFEANYLRFHSALPSIVTCPSVDLILKGRLERTFRFVHIDGCHLYSIVRQDIHTAERLLIKNGILAIDDYRSVHTPGVAAASWQEVTSGRLIPFCLTPQKMYAVWYGSPLGFGKHLTAWAKRRSQLTVDVEMVSNRKLLRLRMNA